MRLFKTACVLFLSCMTVAAFADTNRETASATSRARYNSIVDKDDTMPENLIGFEVGPGVANAAYNVAQGAAPQTNTRTRPIIGAYFEHKFIPYLSIRPELSYVQRGYSITDGQGQGAITQDIATNFIEVPVMVKGQLPLGMFTPYIMTGPFAGILLGDGVTNSGPNGSQDLGTNNLFNTFEFGWNFAVGSSLTLSKHVSLDLNVRYSLGLTNDFANPNPGTSAHFNVVEVVAGVGFAI